jgi:hypothetical protein
VDFSDVSLFCLTPEYTVTKKFFVVIDYVYCVIVAVPSKPVQIYKTVALESMDMEINV